MHLVSAGVGGGSNYWTVSQCYSVMLCGYLVYVYDIYIYTRIYIYIHVTYIYMIYIYIYEIYLYIYIYTWSFGAPLFKMTPIHCLNDVNPCYYPMARITFFDHTICPLQRLVELLEDQHRRWGMVKNRQSSRGFTFSPILMEVEHGRI